MHILASTHALTIFTYALLPSRGGKKKKRQQEQGTKPTLIRPKTLLQDLSVWIEMHAATLDNAAAGRIHHSEPNNCFFHFPDFLRADHYVFFSTYCSSYTPIFQLRAAKTSEKHSDFQDRIPEFGEITLPRAGTHPLPGASQPPQCQELA